MNITNHLPPLVLRDGDRAGLGTLVFGGYGSSSMSSALQLHPAAQTAAGDPFHSALWVSEAEMPADHTLMVQCQSHVQLRWAPEPWHCAWVLPAYQDRNRLHYVIAKPNGWEYGMRHPDFVVTEAEATPERPANDGQAILAGGDLLRFPIGTPVLFTITTKGRRLAISLNGQMVFNRLVASRLLDLVPFSGRVGVMTEDCTVTVTEVVTW